MTEKKQNTETTKEPKPRNFLRITDTEKNKVISQTAKYPQKITSKTVYETSDGHKLKIESSCKTELKVLSSKESPFNYLSVFGTISIAQGKTNPKIWLIFDKEKGYLCSIEKHDLKHALFVFLSILKADKKRKRSVIHNI